jgi:hypothetical protein
LLLLAGYFYAHVLIKYLKPRQQMITHAVLLVASLATLPIIPSASFKATGAEDPTGRILLLLAATVGLPYTILSATSPLLQAWFLRTHKGAVPYRLFALSNFGSFLALLSYPFFFEPNLTLHTQAYIWSGAYVVFALVCALTAYKSKDGEDPLQSHSPEQEHIQPPSLRSKLLWIGLSACASVLLLAVTSHLTQNVAPIPLLWIVPLSLYLLSFILAFESDKLYPRWLFLPSLAVALALFTFGISWYESNLEIKLLIPALCGALFICCMVCHGELSRRRPHPRYLTQFYLMVSVGGAIGGLFVAMIAPRAFSDYLELPIALVVLAALTGIALWRSVTSPTKSDFAKAAIVFIIEAAAVAYLYRSQAPSSLKTWKAAAFAAGGTLVLIAAGFVISRMQAAARAIVIRVAMGVGVLAFGVYLGYAQYKRDSIYIRNGRNFYGVLHVRDDKDGDYGIPAERVLVHGTIDHGTQLKSDKEGRIPTSYFGRTAGISRALRALHDTRGPLRIGILGLGAGVTATLSKEGDTIHYYEINDLVREIATTDFGFYNATPAKKDILMGDARLILEKLPSEQLDFLAMDAFTSDAVPAHLLTREAYQVYLKHLKPNGILCVHISNRYLDLKPVVAAAAAEIGWTGMIVDDEGTEQPYYSGSTFVLLSPDPKFFEHRFFKEEGIYPLKTQAGFKGWTDDFSNLLKILK